MALIARLRREHAMGVLFVTHDLSVVEEHADAIHVLYAGRSVERGASAKSFSHIRATPTARRCWARWPASA